MDKFADRKQNKQREKSIMTTVENDTLTSGHKVGSRKEWLAVRLDLLKAEKELEDVEADVLVELRVFDAERDAVAEEDPGLPLRGRARACDQGEQSGDA